MVLPNEIDVLISIYLWLYGILIVFDNSSEILANGRKRMSKLELLFQKVFKTIIERFALNKK